MLNAISEQNQIELGFLHHVVVDDLCECDDIFYFFVLPLVRVQTTL